MIRSRIGRKSWVRVIGLLAVGMTLVGTISTAGALGTSGPQMHYKPLKYVRPLATLPAVKLPARFAASSAEDCWAVQPSFDGKGSAGNTLYKIDFYLAWCTPHDKSRITRWFDRQCHGHPADEAVVFDSCNTWTGGAGYSTAPFEVDWYLHSEYWCNQQYPCHNYYSPYATGTVHANPPSVTGTVYFN